MTAPSPSNRTSFPLLSGIFVVRMLAYVPEAAMVKVTVPLKAPGVMYWGRVATPAVTVRKLSALLLSPLALTRLPLRIWSGSEAKMSCSVLR